MEPFDYLQQNASEMATIVETYLVEETVDLIHDNEKLEKWNNLVKELGLLGQEQIRQPEKSPIPFLVMNNQLFNIFNTLCPSHTAIAKYNQMPVPIEILDLVSLSIREKYFEDIEIWYDEQQKDPVCVGINYIWQPHNGNTFTGVECNSEKECEDQILTNGLDAKPYKMSWRASRYLIGKWADVKQSFSELRKRALDRYITQTKSMLEKEILDRKRKIEDLQFDAMNLFGGNSSTEPLPF